MSERRLTILQVNDLHGYLEPHPEAFAPAGGSATRPAGVARIASVFNQVRAERPGAVLALDNGDTFHGTWVAVESQGEALVPAMNALEFDAMTSHWEFAFGLGIVGIASNIVDKSMPPSYSTGVRFTLGNLELPAHIERLRTAERVDLVVVLSHLGFAHERSSPPRSPILMRC